MSDTILTHTHFQDIITEKHLMDDNDRLPGRDGSPGTGLKFNEAIMLAQSWWDVKGRLMMPDYGKPPEQQVMKSGVMMGYPFHSLTRQEMMRVVAQWYVNIGIYQIVEGRSTSDDTDLEKKMGDIREESKDILPVLSDEMTHKKTDPNLEKEVWADEYEQIEKDDMLVDTQGNQLKPMEETNGKSNAKNKGSIN